ncbi:MAG: 2-oxoglutarate dehydrogenase E1 component [Herpetosiphon sp.]
MSEYLFHGPNAGYVQELFERFVRDAQSVDAETRAFFADWTPEEEATSKSAVVTSVGNGQGLDAQRIVGAARLTRLWREYGYLAAHVDPLGTAPAGSPELEPTTHGITLEDLAALPATVVDGPLAATSANAAEAFSRLRVAYSRHVGYDFAHVQDHDERDWMREAAESGRFFAPFDTERRREVLQRLTEVEAFEQYLHQTFPGQKRFSIEGCDMLVPMLDSIIRNASTAGTREIVIGMAHRGRLNVLAHVLGKPYEHILWEFETAHRDQGVATAGKSSLGWTGDVKYHVGARRAYRESGIEQMPITLLPNPSHLEFVDPVIVGSARAAQEERMVAGTVKQDAQASLALMIHGDAAFPGQGIVAETLNLSRLAGYNVGGTIHIIVNNQIGFTTDSQEDRSTLFASDLAKGFEIPIVHVNADDPHACIAVARMASEYRERFGKDFLIDLVGYRRWGHNEGDEPQFTQPQMYGVIGKHATVRKLWADHLIEGGVITADEVQQMIDGILEKLRAARKAGQSGPEEATQDGGGGKDVPIETGVALQRLETINRAVVEIPAEIMINPKLRRMLDRRAAAIDGEAEQVDWAHAETLAFATLLADGVPIRLTGQDVERGTFSQRHVVLHHQVTGERFVPLQAFPQARASFAVHNSPLSENAALGFEYGYSVHAQETLVLWEAQFGDFANSGQVIIDQFIVPGRAKWRQNSGLVLLLPHGYEGQGPEHSSARLERFLQLAAGDNLRIVNCSTAAQYFHLIRRQAALMKVDPRPLVVMTPKSLLRNPLAGSSKEAFTSGSFRPLLEMPLFSADRSGVKRLVLSAGKIGVELWAEAQRTPDDAVAMARVEELYPFPAEEIGTMISSFGGLREVVWLQEEPQNMGAWSFLAPRLLALLPQPVELRYVGRPAFASPAEGSLLQHKAEQERIIQSALEDIVETQTPVTGAQHGS